MNIRRNQALKRTVLATKLRVILAGVCIGISAIGFAASATDSPAPADESGIATPATVAADLSAGTSGNETYKLPVLTIDAEKARYQGLITRPQDEISQDVIIHRPTSNPVEMLRSLNSSVTPGSGLLGAIFTR